MALVIEFDTFCGICDSPMLLSTQEQKYILEVKRVPVKMLLCGAAYCPECRQRRSRINYLRRKQQWRQVVNGEEELRRLRQEEKELQQRSRRRYADVNWPYSREAS